MMVNLEIQLLLYIRIKMNFKFFGSQVKKEIMIDYMVIIN